MIKRRLSVVLASFLTLPGCADEIPTASDGDLLPVDAVTVEFRLPFSEFAADFQIFDGFGTPALLPVAVIAEDWGGTVDSRALLRFGNFPASVTVRSPGDGALVTDSDYVPVSGRVTLLMDTVSVHGTAPFTLEVGAIQSAWHPGTATWLMSTDTVGTREFWPEPGGGPTVTLDQSDWDPHAVPTGGDDENGDPDAPPPQVDTVSFAIDSTTVTQWGDPTRLDRGLQVSIVTPQSRLLIREAVLLLSVRSDVNPDTLISVPVPLSEATFISESGAEVPAEAFVIGGAPAVRATFRLDLPPELPGSAEVCALVSCPIELLPERLVYAGLELRTHDAIPFGLRPLERIVLELRPVLDPGRLPRSPLGFPLACPTGQCPLLLPFTFVDEEDYIESGVRIDFPMTPYVRDLLRDPATLPNPVPATLALLNGLDPSTGLEVRALQHAAFWAPGTEFEPILRLIFTVSTGVPSP